MKDITKRIPLILKELRQQRGWSLDKTAEKTGVSKAMLGQIERQESSPTITTLWKIASGFDTTFSSFLEDATDNLHEPVFRPSKVKDIHPADKKFRVAPLFPFDKKLNCEIFLIEILPTYEHLSPPHQAGVVEHIIVVDGTMEVLVNKKWKTLHKGEGLRFNANQPHGYRNTTQEIACFHDIIHYPGKMS